MKPLRRTHENNETAKISFINHEDKYIEEDYVAPNS